jgi:hypothetical protein
MATLAELQTRKEAYLAAELQILKAQDYTISDGVINRRTRRAELEQVREAIKEIDAQIEAMGGGASGPRLVRTVRVCR